MIFKLLLGIFLFSTFLNLYQNQAYSEKKLYNTSHRHLIKKRDVSLITLCRCNGGIQLDCAGDSVCSYDCNNKYRDSNEVDCMFPFFYKNTWFDSCTSVDKGYFWCSLDQNYTGRFALCAGACSKLAQLKTGDLTHTSCITAPAGTLSVFPGPAQIQFILDRHNLYRSNVTPSATDLRTVYWDVALARQAQKWAENPTIGHDGQNNRDPLNMIITSGQNAWFGWGYKFSPQSSDLTLNNIWAAALWGWYSEVYDWAFGVGTINGTFYIYT